ncbi:hypothetical protein Pse7367_2420 [Thalassoporum mexicanum PCC 7367]|nr:hypothetical protein [Pseudanabaena sp. PCC 7367]AFY70681.1 hypothetical protein Pse7367_2420 [Pseudanabaena sp. PCC 7367]
MKEPIFKLLLFVAGLIITVAVLFFWRSYVSCVNDVEICLEERYNDRPAQ